jgi:TonB-linked SusC/RagA family outer membrane protein
MKLMRLLALLFVMAILPGYLLAQQVTVKGRITDSKTNTPLAGATVRVKNDKASATSDANGNFTISAPSSESIISITYVGYQVFEVKAGDGNLTIGLVNLDTGLDEVIVVGYGTQKKAHLTGAVETIKAADVDHLPVGNLGAALTGRVLGASISGGTSRPGSMATITIRNPLSLAKDGGNNNPLYVIDGVIQVTSQGVNDATLFNSLDPSEVESITFLKDGAAAVYGSRAANGAIIITTKRGKAGTTRISYSGSYAVNDEVYRTKMMSAYDLARYINIINGPNGANETAGDPEYFFSDDELEHYQTINHDWLDQAWKSSYNTRHSFNISGGTDKTNYFANVSYYTQDGNLGRLEYGKWTYRAGLDAEVATGLKASLQVSGNQQQSSRVNSEIGGENIENDYRNLLRAPRYIPTYINGRPAKLPGPGGNNVAAYHFFELNRLNNYIDADLSTLTMNAALEYKVPFVKGLVARGSYARNTSSNRDQRIGGKYMLWRFNLAGENGHIYETIPGDTVTVRDSATYSNDNRIRLGNTRSVLSQANFSLAYQRDFGPHSVSAYFGVERSESSSTQEEVYREDPSPFTNGQLNTAFGAIDGRSFAYESGNLGYIGRINYNYSGKYLAEFLFRTDASTKFAPENYWGRFYSLSAGWVISEEKFFSATNVNFLKLRYSIGLLGKDDTRPWQWRQRYTFQNGQGGSYGADNSPAIVGMKMEVSPNPDVTWSDDLKQNLGIDARFFSNRLSTTVELFYNQGTNMLIERTGVVPVTVGGSIASQNWGKVDFFGYELAIGWRDNIGKDFTYGVETRFVWSDNKVKQGNFNDFDIQFPWNAQPGQSSDNGKWGYDAMGIFQDQADIDAYISKNNITSVFGTDAVDLRPGMLYYRDVRGALQADGTFAGPDGIIDVNDQIRLSKKASNHYGVAMTLRAGYKSFGFDCVIGGSFGGWSEIDARAPLEGEIVNLNKNGPSYWANIYDPELNPTGNMPNPYWDDINTTPVSNFWKVSSLRLRVINANVNYSLPKRITEFLKISNARVVVSALNPLNLFNPFDYKDPDSGWDNYPVLRTFSFGLNVTL